MEKIQLSKLTNRGRAVNVAISPDGQSVAYALRESGKDSLWLRRVGTNSAIQILPPDEGFLIGLTFSPDGDYIYFVRSRSHEFADHLWADLFKIPTLGGRERKLIADVWSAVSFSPNGDEFVFTREILDKRTRTEVRIAHSDGSGDRLLAAVPSAYFEASYGAAWSPDGSLIALSLAVGNPPSFVLETVSTADGTVRELYRSLHGMGRPRWLPSGKGLVVTLNDENYRGQLSTVSYPRGEARRLTNGLDNYDPLFDATPDGRLLAAIHDTGFFSIWAAPFQDLTGIEQISSGAPPMIDVATLTDGRLVALSDDLTLWLVSVEGRKLVQIPDVQAEYPPSTCGQFILFSALSSGVGIPTLIDVNLLSTKPIIGAVPAESPACSPDGQFLFYIDCKAGCRIRRLRINGGAPSDVAQTLGTNAVALSVSPNGKLLAYSFVDAEGRKIAVIPIEGNPLLRIFSVRLSSYVVHWSLDGKQLQYLVTQDGVTNIWEQQLAGGKPKQLTRYTSGRILNFSWSPDGSKLFLSRGYITSYVVLLRTSR